MQPLEDDVNRRLQDYLRGRERFRRKLLIGAVVIASVVLCLIGIVIYRAGGHLATSMKLHAKGLEVEWFGADGSLWSGGFNEVAYHPSRNQSDQRLTEDDFRLLHRIGPVTSLDLSNCFDLGDAELGSLGALTDLTDLRLDRSRSIPLGGRRLTDKILVSISKLKGLRTLSLNGLPITDAGVPSLTNLDQLEDLDLDHTRITDASLPVFAKLPKLRYLRIAGTRVTAEAISGLQRDAPNVTVLRVSE